MIRTILRSLVMLTSLSNLSGYAEVFMLDFNDGFGAGVAIDDFYASHGVTFFDAVWSDGFDGRPGTSSPLQLGSLSTPSLPKATNPITGVFSSPVDMIAISAIDVGFNDARIDAYDAETGGNLIGFDVFEGVTELGNTFTSIDTEILSINAYGIRRIELYQPNSSQIDDGVAFDNLVFNVVPEPSSLLALTFAWIGLGMCRRNHRMQQRSGSQQLGHHKTNRQILVMPNVRRPSLST